MSWLTDLINGQYVTRSEFNKLKGVVMASQEEVDALTAQVTQVAADLDSAKQTLQSEINALAQANPNLDLSALHAAVDPLDAAVQQLGQLQPSSGGQ